MKTCALWHSTRMYFKTTSATYTGNKRTCNAVRQHRRCSHGGRSKRRIYYMYLSILPERTENFPRRVWHGAIRTFSAPRKFIDAVQTCRRTVPSFSRSFRPSARTWRARKRSSIINFLPFFLGDESQYRRQMMAIGYCDPRAGGY